MFYVIHMIYFYSFSHLHFYRKKPQVSYTTCGFFQTYSIGIYPNDRPVGWLFGFLTYLAGWNTFDDSQNISFHYRLVFNKNHTTALQAWKCTPSAFGISPVGGEVLRTWFGKLQLRFIPLCKSDTYKEVYFTMPRKKSGPSGRAPPFGGKVVP